MITILSGCKLYTRNNPFTEADYLKLSLTDAAILMWDLSGSDEKYLHQFYDSARIEQPGVYSAINYSLSKPVRQYVSFVTDYNANLNIVIEHTNDKKFPYQFGVYKRYQGDGTTTCKWQSDSGKVIKLAKNAGMHIRFVEDTVDYFYAPGTVTKSAIWKFFRALDNEDMFLHPC